jgi:hypothetical protein
MILVAQALLSEEKGMMPSPIPQPLPRRIYEYPARQKSVLLIAIIAVWQIMWTSKAAVQPMRKVQHVLLLRKANVDQIAF